MCHTPHNSFLFIFPAIQDDERLSAEEMDERRRQNIAYEYLCHLEEAKRYESGRTKGRDEGKNFEDERSRMTALEYCLLC